MSAGQESGSPIRENRTLLPAPLPPDEARGTLAAAAGVSTVGLRPPFDTPAAAFSSCLSRHSHLDCRARPRPGPRRTTGLCSSPRRRRSGRAARRGRPRAARRRFSRVLLAPAPSATRHETYRRQFPDGEEVVMLRMRAELVAKVRAAQVPQDLYEYLQGSIELEHSTIPPYLTALYSLKPGKKNLTVARIIRSIVIEEMLHMTIAANVLNAIGGSPNINKPGFVPTYPGPLPMIVDDFKVGLSKLTRELVEKVFMRIEQPEYHVQLQMRAAAMTAAAAADAKTYATVGEFYNAIIEKLTELDAKGPLFTGKPAWQVVDNTFYTPDELFPIVDL